MRHNPKHKHLLIINIILAGIVITASCVSNSQLHEEDKTPTAVYPFNEIGDGGFLSKQPCGPPCFMGITPDITVKADVINYLEQKVDINLCKTWNRQADGGDQGITCNPISVTFQDNDVVDTIWFTPSTNMSMEDVLKIHGNPSTVTVSSDGDEDGNILSVDMKLYYDQLKAVVALKTQKNTIFEVKETTSIMGISYYSDINYFDNLIFNEPWHGLGEYQISPSLHFEGGSYP